MVTALLPDQHTTVGQVSRLFDDLSSACDVAGITLVGGHTEITSGVDRPILVGMLLGEATPSSLLLPGRAKPGDRLLITAPIAIEGTALLAREMRSEFLTAFGESFTDRCAALLIEPGISISHHASETLAAGGVTALHDPTEGGLATGIREIAEVSGCGAVVNRDLIPVLDETVKVSDYFGLDPLGLLASGSLLVAATPEHVKGIQHAAAAMGFKAALIGKLTVPERGFTMVSEGTSAQLPTFEIDEVARLFSARRLPE
jgi:hydrogenase maturation factor